MTMNESGNVMKSTVFSAIKNLTKLGVAGGVIFGIGFALVAQDPTSTEVGPAPAKADISDFMGAPASRSAQFTEAMVAMGMAPRMYDFNGNVMFFAVGATEKGVRPRQALREIQAHLVDQGVNKSNHADMVPLRQAAGVIDWEAASKGKGGTDARFKPLVDKAGLLLDGEVVPTEVTDDYVEMVGYEKNRSVDDLSKLFEGDESNKKVGNLMGGYRYIDAFYDEAHDRTEISAVWSSEDFSSGRMDGTADDQSPPDPDVPACMGCERDYRMQTIDKGDAFSGNMYRTNVGVQQTYDFYRNSMAKRGWRESKSQLALNKLAQYMPELREIREKGRVLSLERDGESMQLTILKEEDMPRTHVFTTHESEGAQSVFGGVGD